jgi:hypothetical protein
VGELSSPYNFIFFCQEVLLRGTISYKLAASGNFLPLVRLLGLGSLLSGDLGYLFQLVTIPILEVPIQAVEGRQLPGSVFTLLLHSLLTGQDEIRPLLVGRVR